MVNTIEQLAWYSCVHVHLRKSHQVSVKEFYTFLELCSLASSKHNSSILLKQMFQLLLCYGVCVLCHLCVVVCVLGTVNHLHVGVCVCVCVCVCACVCVLLPSPCCGMCAVHCWLSLCWALSTISVCMLFIVGHLRVVVHVLFTFGHLCTVVCVLGTLHVGVCMLQQSTNFSIIAALAL